ncbi:MAG: RNA polymerase sigma factor [Prolixibacteraceae bacterium]
MIDRQKLIEKCLADNSKAQKELFDLLSPMLLSVCHRYANNKNEAEDIFQESFLKIYENINQLRNAERLEGWAKQIAVHEAIAFYKKQRRLVLSDEIYPEKQNLNLLNSTYQQIEVNELMLAIQQLPDRMRLVMNLYAIEGYKHEEIAEKLGISVGTSKSNLFDARKKLKGLISDEQRKSI